MEPRRPRYPIGPRAVEHLAQKEELAQLPPQERHARMQEMRKERMAKRAQMNKLKGEERQKLRQELRAKKP
jgi:cell division protein FtsB